MSMAADDIARLIKERFPDAEIRIEDLAGDGDLYAATITSAEFRGKTRIQQRSRATWAECCTPLRSRPRRHK